MVVPWYGIPIDVFKTTGFLVTLRGATVIGYAEPSLDKETAKVSRSIHHLGEPQVPRLSMRVGTPWYTRTASAAQGVPWVVMLGTMWRSHGQTPTVERGPARKKGVLFCLKQGYITNQ